MLEFVRKSQDGVLVAYNIKDENGKYIGHSSISSKDGKKYILDINILDKQDIEDYFHEVLRQNLYRFINMGKHGIVLEYHLKKNSKGNALITRALAIERFKLGKSHDLTGNDIYEYQTNLAGMRKNSRSVATTKNNKSSKISRTRKSSRTKKNITPLSIKVKGYEKSFIISSAKINSLIYTPLQEYLAGLGFHETDDANARLVIMWTEMLENYKFDSRYFKTESFIMNQLDDSKEIITNKANLYENFKKHYPQQCKEFMATSWPLKSFMKTMQDNPRDNPRDKNKYGYGNWNGGAYIVRPAGKGAFSGKDIYIVSNPRQIADAYNKTRKYEKVLISEYITNPLLLDKRKFHLRVYFMVGLLNNDSDGDIFVSKVFDFCKVFKAIKPYFTHAGQVGDWDDKNIHDTHARGNPRDIFWPYDVPSYLREAFQNIYMPKIRECLRFVSKFIQGKIMRYPQSRNAFEIFGCDFLITDDDRVILMEINDKVGYGCLTTEATLKFSQLYFDIIIKYILTPLLESHHGKEQIDTLKKLDWLVFSKI
jgi:hypothetical protein